MGSRGKATGSLPVCPCLGRLPWPLRRGDGWRSGVDCRNGESSEDLWRYSERGDPRAVSNEPALDCSVRDRWEDTEPWRCFTRREPRRDEAGEWSLLPGEPNEISMTRGSSSNHERLAHLAGTSCHTNAKQPYRLQGGESRKRRRIGDAARTVIKVATCWSQRGEHAAKTTRCKHVTLCRKGMYGARCK